MSGPRRTSEEQCRGFALPGGGWMVCFLDSDGTAVSTPVVAWMGKSVWEGEVLISELKPYEVTPGDGIVDSVEFIRTVLWHPDIVGGDALSSHEAAVKYLWAQLGAVAAS